MKKIYLGFFILILLIVLTSCARTEKELGSQTDKYQENHEIQRGVDQVLEGEAYIINQPASVVKWSAQKLLVRTSDHFGLVDIKEGVIILDGDNLVGGEVLMDMRSIRNMDLRSEVLKEELEEHLKSKDFFDVDNFPEAKFTMKKLEAIDDVYYDYLLSGDLQIKESVNQVETKIKVNRRDSSLTAEARFEIDRTRWGLTYGSGGFIDDLGDDTIDDIIEFDMRIVAELK